MRGPHGDPMGPMVGPQGPIRGEGGTCKIPRTNWKYLEIHWTNWFLELLPSSFVPDFPKTLLPGSFRALGCSKTRAFWTLGFYFPGAIPFWSDVFIRKEISCGNLFPVTRKTLLYRLVQISANLPCGKTDFFNFPFRKLVFSAESGSREFPSSGAAATTTTQDHGLPGQVPSPHAPRNNISRSGVPLTPTFCLPDCWIP